MYVSGITRRFPVETMCVKDKRPSEIVEVMKKLPDLADVEPEDVPKTVSLDGLSMAEVVNVYALYQRYLHKDVVEFSADGKKHLGRDRKEAA